MDIQNRIKNIEPYFKGLEYIGEYVLVKILYKKKWSVLPSDNENVKISIDDDNKELFYYYSNKNIDCNNIFDLIDKTIKFNMESENKVALLKEKIEELRTIFLENDIDTLKRLKFSFDKKRKYIKKNNSNDNNKENVINKDE